MRKKVLGYHGFKSLSEIIYPQNKFNLEKVYKDYPQYKALIGSGGRERRLTTSIFSLKEIFTEEKINEKDICIIGLINNNERTKRYINEKYLEKNSLTYNYKVLVPKSNGSGAIGEVLSTPLVGVPLVGVPLVGFTQSFIGIGNFTTYGEALALLKYIKSRFARALLGIKKVTQDNPKDTWEYVPQQDFTDKSDIDWSKSIAEIDQQLYKKYNLSDEEIAFIESMIQPME